MSVQARNATPAEAFKIVVAAVSQITSIELEPLEEERFFILCRGAHEEAINMLEKLGSPDAMYKENSQRVFLCMGETPLERGKGLLTVAAGHQTCSAAFGLPG